MWRYDRVDCRDYRTFNVRPINKVYGLLYLKVKLFVNYFFDNNNAFWMLII